MGRAVLLEEFGVKGVSKVGGSFVWPLLVVMEVFPIVSKWVGGGKPNLGSTTAFINGFAHLMPGWHGLFSCGPMDGDGDFGGLNNLGPV